MKKYEHKRITVHGKVSKLMSGVMGRTFLHLIDNQAGSTKYDLTVTTRDQVAVNDFVTAQGVITLNKNFGSGYFYEIIMEDARIQKRN